MKYFGLARYNKPYINNINVLLKKTLIESQTSCKPIEVFFEFFVKTAFFFLSSEDDENQLTGLCLTTRNHKLANTR